MKEALFDSVTSLYKYRELIWSLVSKELKARYRGSTLGMFWTLLNPLLLLMVYALVFSVYMRIQVENYAVFMFTGLLPWLWFSSSIMEGVNSITASGNLITKSMFPAEILPMVKIVSNLFNYLFSLPLLLLFMLYYQVAYTPAMLWLPLLMLAQLIFTIGLVYFFASINVRFRDVQHILANFIVLWFFICPILYPTTSVPEEFHFTFYINPMAIMTIGYQDIFIKGTTPHLIAIFGVVIIGIGFSVLGFWKFQKDKNLFAENI